MYQKGARIYSIRHFLVGSTGGSGRSNPVIGSIVFGKFSYSGGGVGRGGSGGSGGGGGVGRGGGGGGVLSFDIDSNLLSNSNVQNNLLCFYQQFSRVSYLKEEFCI